MALKELPPHLAQWRSEGKDDELDPPDFDADDEVPEPAARSLQELHMAETMRAYKGQDKAMLTPTSCYKLHTVRTCACMLVCLWSQCSVDVCLCVDFGSPPQV